MTMTPTPTKASDSPEIAFIPNDEFESIADEDLSGSNVSFYVDEETCSGSLDQNSVASSMLNALQSSRLLTFEGEQLLFKKLNFLRFRANAIQMSLPSSKPAKRKLQEIERLLTDAEEVREALAEANLRLVASIAGKLAKSREEFDEFFAEGSRILLYAIDKFDFARGYRFSTYATHSVQRHLYRVINRRRKRAEREFSREPELMMSEVSASPEGDHIDAKEMQDAAAAVISRIEEALDERESFIVRGRFGLDGSGKGKTFSAMGEQLGLSKERVRQLCQRGLEKLGEIARPYETLFSTT